MDEQAQLWGTVSVLDHKRPNAFVAELGLFDVLVVPVQPPDGGGEWAGEWDGAAQDRLLKLIPDDRLRRVSWDERQRGEWARRAHAELADHDVALIQQKRQEYVAGGGTVTDYHAEPLHDTRQVLQDFVDADRDRALIKGMPQVPVTVIPAYNGPELFVGEEGKPEPLADAIAAEPLQGRLLRAFQWEFFAPADKDKRDRPRKHEDLIRAALDLAALPEVRAHRQAFRAWTSVEAARGTDPVQARAKMKELLDAYAKAVKAAKIPVVVRWGCGIVELAAAGVAVIATPWFGVVGPLLKLGQMAGEKRLSAADKIDPAVRPAALVHGLREAFDAVEPAGLAPREASPLPLKEFWPGSTAALYI
ncbi:MAG: hypothetical protein O7G83_16900 [Proteobacteria bacterium]|nr:hypothetical protein [Pseudomonadota bacterium]